MIKVQDWSIVKNFLDTRKIPCDWHDLGHAYWIMASDATFAIEIFLAKTDPASADQLDFETNYKASGNVSKTDLEGVPVLRSKAGNKGWHFQKQFIGITTSTINGVVNKDHLGNSLGFCTYKMFKADGTETSSPSSAVKTQVDWTPNHDFEVIGGSVEQSTPPAGNLYLWVIGAPGIADIPFLQGGANLKLIGMDGSVRADGKAAKFMKYNDPIPGTNTFRILAEHTLGLQHQFQMSFEIFKE